MATSEDFERANARGRDAEQRVAHICVDAGFDTEWVSRGTRRDLCVKHPSFGREFIEVKNEDNYAEGDNACIELHQKGRVSGLLASESTIYVHTFGEMCLTFRTQAMRNQIARWLSSGVLHEVPFGDNQNSGVIVTKMMIAMKDFAEWLPLSELPHSKVFAAVPV